VHDPANGRLLARVADGGAADVQQAIAAADEAAAGWAARTAYDRSAFLYEAHRVMLERSDDLAALMTTEQGKPLRAARIEVKYAADFLLWFAEEAKRVYGQVIPSPRADQRFLVLHQPSAWSGA
jgi:succinate-semialdehyde dehydrogenase/glutarate-semialdehyde dehydrogenase